MSTNLSAIKNLVFDLGGVLYAIDPALTVAALGALAGRHAREMTMDDPLFLDFEMGKIDPPAFRAALRAALDSSADDHALDQAWNALLLGPIAGRLALLQALSAHYRIILLSNTNTIHQAIWGPQCAEMFAVMEKTWFSFDMGLRKPDPEIYRYVLKAMGMAPSESLFLDDSLPNIQSAASVGMATCWVDPKVVEQLPNLCLELL